MKIQEISQYPQKCQGSQFENPHDLHSPSSIRFLIFTFNIKHAFPNLWVNESGHMQLSSIFCSSQFIPKMRIQNYPHNSDPKIYTILIFMPHHKTQLSYSLSWLLAHTCEMMKMTIMRIIIKYKILV